MTKRRRRRRNPIEGEEEVPRKDAGRRADSKDKEEKGPFREAIGYVPVLKLEIKNSQKARVR